MQMDKSFKKLKPGSRAGDPAQGRQLWNFSTQMTARARQGAVGEPKVLLA
jgi:hypothetical protein